MLTSSLPLHSLPEGDYLEGHSISPITRINCKVCTLAPTECDGTCLDCRKERNSYRESWIAKRKESWIGNNGGDPDEDIPDFESLYEQRLEKITKAKKAIIEARKYLLSQSILAEKSVQERVQKKMNFLEMSASQPLINMPITSREVQ